MLTIEDPGAAASRNGKAASAVRTVARRSMAIVASQLAWSLLGAMAEALATSTSMPPSAAAASLT